MANEHADSTATDRAAESLSAAGWSIDDIGGPGGWIVHGNRGDERIEAHGSTRLEAWHTALAQAESMPAFVVEPRPR
jgi:hypothetical protein